MKKLLLILAGVMAVGLLVFAASWRVAERVCIHQVAKNPDDLLWLQREFHLSDAELARVRKLHESYLPKCEEYCGEIARRQARVEALLKAGKLDDPDLETNLREIGVWRARCQAEMLRHFQAVARAMPPEQGRRYLDVLTQWTLGAHQQIEARMAADAKQGAEAAHVHQP
jgi:hypothetical protein